MNILEFSKKNCGENPRKNNCTAGNIGLTKVGHSASCGFALKRYKFISASRQYHLCF
jgi:hypothetical protein